MVNRYNMETEYNRFACEDQVVLKEDDYGEYVKFADYAALAAQVEALNKSVRMPSTEDDALTMALLGMSWLQRHAPEKLTELNGEIRAEAGRNGYLQGIADYQQAEAEYKDFWIDTAANQYADAIRQEVK